jgi:hypothetical protein
MIAATIANVTTSTGQAAAYSAIYAATFYQIVAVSPLSATDLA